MMSERQWMSTTSTNEQDLIIVTKEPKALFTTFKAKVISYPAFVYAIKNQVDCHLILSMLRKAFVTNHKEVGATDQELQELANHMIHRGKVRGVQKVAYKGYWSEGRQRIGCQRLNSTVNFPQRGIEPATYSLAPTASSEYSTP